ncbi:MAG: 2-oxoacid:acceptor oxidoreductase subunit alpha [Patescibacteria group bacterium]|jgi:2-oxoglutarate ferredoxin oxidoreductase subunit alpha
MKQVTNRFTWKIGGAAGDGIMVTGAMLGKIFTRAGLWVVDYSEYPSLIRGGHNTQVVQVDEEQIFSHDQGNEILVALNEETVRLHAKEISPNGVIIYDEERLKILPAMIGNRNDISLMAVPFKKIAADLGGKDIMQNTVALGASLGFLTAPFELVEDVMHDTFDDKGEAIVKMNIDIAKAGYEYVLKNFKKEFPWRIKPKKSEKRIIIGGNDAISLGLIQGGLKFYSAYPMTPASSILSTLAELAPTYGHITKHSEDEISAINLAIGASYAGVRAATGTSGGGFCLMTEGLGLAAETETPLVVINAQRPGPSTGMPTWTEQGDLRMVMHASQGDFPRVVVAPGNPEQAFYESIRALNLAELFQTQVIILTDKYLAESHWTSEFFDIKKIKIEKEKLADLRANSDYFKRYLNTKNGISPRSIPGQAGGIFTANSDEHNEFGFTSEAGEDRKMQMEKRAKKFQAISEYFSEPVVKYGPETADVTLVTWGSTTLVCQEALRKLNAMGINANILQILYILPFPTGLVTANLKNSKKTILIENNFSAQLGGVIREYTGLVCNEKLLKYDGRPFWPEEIVEFVKKNI